MTQEELQKALEAIGKGGINVNGDLVLEKHVEHEIGNVEAGGIGIQINNGMAPSAKEDGEEECAITKGGGNLTEWRQAILDQLLDWVERGDWVKEVTAEEVKTMLRTVLGIGEMPLSEREAEMSATLWEMLERGRGNDRVKITWQNMVGYFADKKLFNKNGSPSLNEDFFGTKNDYSNIDKGRPSKDSMPPRFKKIIPLLDKFVPTRNTPQK